MQHLKLCVVVIALLVAECAFSAPPDTTSVDEKAGRNAAPTESGARRPDQCSLPDCSCRVVSLSGESLCEGGTEEETAAGVHYCKCGKFGAPSGQSVGAGGVFTVGGGGAVDRSEPADDAVVSVADPQNPDAQPASPASAARQDTRRGPATAQEQKVGASGGTCIAEYETADGMEVFFRGDRKVTGVWTAKPGPRTPFQKPGLIVADANGCLYGCTGNVWEPLDCPGGDFSSPKSYPGEFTMGASCSSTSTSSLRWRRVNEGRDGATIPPTREVSENRFALSHPNTRPPEGQGEGPGATTRQVYCWVEENEIAWWLRCCEYDFEFEVLPIDPGPGVSLMNEPDTVLCAPNSGMEMPDVQDGSIVLRTAGGKDYCMRAGGSFGACAAGFGSRGKGTR